jgi:hypothetical protein
VPARSARPPLFLTGIFWGLTGLALLLAVVVIQRSHVAWWSFVLLALPIGLGALALANLRRGIARPDTSPRP